MQETGIEGLQVHEPKTEEEVQEEVSRTNKELIGDPDGPQRGMEHRFYDRGTVRWKKERMFNFMDDCIFGSFEVWVKVILRYAILGSLSVQ